MYRKIVALASVAGLGLALGGAPAQAEESFGSPELIAAAKAEGKMVLLHRELRRGRAGGHQGIQQAFPEIKVEMVRAPGGQLITRVKTEAAAGKLIADIVDHSDRALMLPLADLFQDYAPPNAADYDPASLVSPKFWPRLTAGLVDRLQHRAGEGPAQDLDGPDQAEI